MQSKVRRIIINFGMLKTKEQYRNESSNIWTSKNILMNETLININLRDFLGTSKRIVMAYLAKKDEINILPSIKIEESLQVPYIYRNKIGRCKYSKELVYSDLGVPTPKIIKVAGDLPDLIIVPGRYFDRFGNRIGRGKGHYDDFLKNHMAAVFVGISLHETLVQILPNNLQDVKMDIIVTEKDVLEFKTER